MKNFELNSVPVDMEIGQEMEPVSKAELNEDFFKNLDEYKFPVSKEERPFFDFFRVSAERNALIHAEKTLLDLTEAKPVLDNVDSDKKMAEGHHELPASFERLARALIKNNNTVPWFDEKRGYLTSQGQEQIIKLISLEYGLEYAVTNRALSPLLESDKEARTAINELKSVYTSLPLERQAELSRLVIDKNYLHQQIQMLKIQAERQVQAKAA